MKFKTYLVGGAVRDQMLGLTSKDLDFVVMAPSFDAMREDLLADGCEIFVEKLEYLTIRAKHPRLGCVDFACARRDGNYTDGRRPETTEVAQTVEEDLARRDFTCNAIAVDVVSGEVVDPFDGRWAISRGVLRCVNSARARFGEDSLRVFRAVRFAVTKHFVIDGEIWEAINAMTSNMFDGVATERIREELLKAFQKDAKRTFELLMRDFPLLWEIASNRGIWLKPTTEKV